jgi:hypothetical protein
MYECLGYPFHPQTEAIYDEDVELRQAMRTRSLGEGRTYQFPLHKTHTGMGKDVKERDLSPFDKIQAELSVESDPVINNYYHSLMLL